MNNFCENCGNALTSDDDVCPVCGNAVIDYSVKLAEAKYAQAQNAAPILSSQSSVTPKASVPYSSQFADNAKPSYQPMPTFEPSVSETMRLGQTIGILLLNCVPIAGMIFMLIFAFGADARAKISRANLAKALLIMRLVGIAVFILLYVLIVILAVAVIGFSPAFPY
ncbi:MAG: hypothetical protein RR654_04905 [Oscillospiraceae bacterium]